MTLTFKLVNFEESRLTSIMWVGLIQSGEALNRTKRLIPLSKEEFSSKQPADWNCSTSSPGSPVCWPTLWIFELASLHNHMSQFFIITLFLYTHPIASLSPENPDK